MAQWPSIVLDFSSQSSRQETIGPSPQSFHDDYFPRVVDKSIGIIRGGNESDRDGENVCVRESLCVCVRERERDCVRDGERERERECERVQGRGIHLFVGREWGGGGGGGRE